MYEKYINNPFNHWRSLKIGQQLGDEDLTDPSFIFGCNNILDTERIEKRIFIYMRETILKQMERIWNFVNT